MLGVAIMLTVRGTPDYTQFILGLFLSVWTFPILSLCISISMSIEDSDQPAPITPNYFFGPCLSVWTFQILSLCILICIPSEDSDQPAHADTHDTAQTAQMRRLICVFVECTCQNVRYLMLRLIHAAKWVHYFSNMLFSSFFNSRNRMEAVFITLFYVSPYFSIMMSILSFPLGSFGQYLYLWK